jgi:hypothetical protein
MQTSFVKEDNKTYASVTQQSRSLAAASAPQSRWVAVFASILVKVCFHV